MALTNIAEIICRVCRCDPDRATNAAAEIWEMVQQGRCHFTAVAGDVGITLSAPTVEELIRLRNDHESRLIHLP